MEKNQHNSARLVWTAIAIAMTLCVIIGLVLYAIFDSPSEDSPVYNTASTPSYHDSTTATNKDIDDDLSKFADAIAGAEQHKKDLNDLIVIADIDGTNYHAEITTEDMKKNAMGVIQSKLDLVNSDKKDLIALKDKIKSADTVMDIDKGVKEFNEKFNSLVIPIVRAGVEEYAGNLKAVQEMSNNVTDKVQTQVETLKDCVGPNVSSRDCESLEIEVRDNHGMDMVQSRLDELKTMTNLMHKLLSVADQLIADYSDFSETAPIEYLEGVATQLDGVLEMSIRVQDLLVGTALSIREV